MVLCKIWKRDLSWGLYDGVDGWTIYDPRLVCATITLDSLRMIDRLDHFQ